MSPVITLAPTKEPWVVLALDCDATLEAGGGPISKQMLWELRKHGVHLVIVSPSSNCDQLVPDIERFALADRVESLRRLAERYPKALHVYTGDTPGDKDTATASGWEYLEPAAVLKLLEREPRGG